MTCVVSFVSVYQLAQVALAGFGFTGDNSIGESVIFCKGHLWPRHIYICACEHGVRIRERWTQVSQSDLKEQTESTGYGSLYFAGAIVLD